MQLTHTRTHTHIHAHTPWLAHLMDRFALYSKNIPRGKGPYNCFLPSELWQALLHNRCLLFILPQLLLFICLYLLLLLQPTFSHPSPYFPSACINVIMLNCNSFLEDVIGSSYSWYRKNSCSEHQTTGLTSSSAPVYSFGSIILPLWPTNTADCMVESYSSHKSYI